MRERQSGCMREKKSSTSKIREMEKKDRSAKEEGKFEGYEMTDGESAIERRLEWEIQKRV